MGKVAGQRVTFRASARIGAIAASLAAAAALLLPSTTLAAPMVIGSAVVGSFTCPLFAPVDSVQLSSTGNSYAVPAGGTITSWSVTAAPGDVGQVGLEVWQPSATSPIPATLIATSSLQTLSLGLNTFPTAITVQPGDLIGLRLEGPLSCMAPIDDATGFPIPGNLVGFISGPVVTTFSGFQLNISATVDVTVTPPPPPPTPTSADQCKHGGWRGLTDTYRTPFKNQGDCVSFVATDGTNAAGAPPADATNAGNGPPADASNAGNGPPADATSAGNGPPADASNAGNGTPAAASNAGNGTPADASNAGNGPPADASNAGNGPPA